MHEKEYLYTYAYTNTCTYAYTHSCTCSYTCSCAYTYRYARTCQHSHAYTYTDMFVTSSPFWLIDFSYFNFSYFIQATERAEEVNVIASRASRARNVNFCLSASLPVFMGHALARYWEIPNSNRGDEKFQNESESKRVRESERREHAYKHMRVHTHTPAIALFLSFSLSLSLYSSVSLSMREQ